MISVNLALAPSLVIAALPLFRSVVTEKSFKSKILSLIFSILTSNGSTISLSKSLLRDTTNSSALTSTEVFFF